MGEGLGGRLGMYEALRSCIMPTRFLSMQSMVANIALLGIGVFSKREIR